MVQMLALLRNKSTKDNYLGLLPKELAHMLAQKLSPHFAVACGESTSLQSDK